MQMQNLKEFVNNRSGNRYFFAHAVRYKGQNSTIGYETKIQETCLAKLSCNENMVNGQPPIQN